MKQTKQFFMDIDVSKPWFDLAFMVISSGKSGIITERFPTRLQELKHFSNGCFSIRLFATKIACWLLRMPVFIAGCFGSFGSFAVSNNCLSISAMQRTSSLVPVFVFD